MRRRCAEAPPLPESDKAAPACDALKPEPPVKVMLATPLSSRAEVAVLELMSEPPLRTTIWLTVPPDRSSVPPATVAVPAAWPGRYGPPKPRARALPNWRVPALTVVPPL